MSIFISYARGDAAVVAELYRDLEQVHSPVWMDTRLSGGQAWWDTILDQIRHCDLFVVAVSPDSIRSEACAAELHYALALGRPLLPVLVRNVAMELADRAIADTQYVDYRSPSKEAAIRLFGAVARRSATPTLPDPLPTAPPPPLSYMDDYRERVDSPSLSYTEQAYLMVDLRDFLGRGEEVRMVALQLIRALRQRGDIAEHVARDIDQLLARFPGGTQPFGPPTPSSQPTPSPQPTRPTQAYQAPPQPRTPPASYPSPIHPAAPAYGSSYGAPSPAPAVAHGGQPHPQGMTIMVLGILGLVICPIVGIVAWNLSGKALREIDANPGLYSDRNNVVLGKWLGIVGIIVWSLILIVYVIVAAAASVSNG